MKSLITCCATAGIAEWVCCPGELNTPLLTALADNTVRDTMLQPAVFCPLAETRDSVRRMLSKMYLAFMSRAAIGFGSCIHIRARFRVLPCR